MTELLLPGAIKEGLVTERFGQAVFYAERVSSTNDWARDLARRGAAEGTLVVAEEQTAGRGRRGRSWLAPRASALLCSLIFRPSLAPAQAARLTMLAGVASAQAIRGLTGQPASLKWPNDILLRGRKLGGILTETEVIADRLLYAVVGIGINVNVEAADLEAISPQATSLLREMGHTVSRRRLLQLLLAEIEARYTGVQADGGQAVYQEWLSHLETIGQDVVVRATRIVETPRPGVSAAGNAGQMAEDVAGTAIGADSDGALLVRLADGTLRRVSVGEIG